MEGGGVSTPPSPPHANFAKTTGVVYLNSTGEVLLFLNSNQLETWDVGIEQLRINIICSKLFKTRECKDISMEKNISKALMAIDKESDGLENGEEH